MLEPSQFQNLQEAALAWAKRAASGGWLKGEDVDLIERVHHRLPDALFESQESRPLVVAFFGGTGVGKSTLLNRLAGREIARTGVVRPTSREISAYVHESVRLRPLPSNLPIDKVQIIHHSNETYRNVLWVDMPDFDSTDQSNHELALGWLPHIDLLIYVVSPERYRDDRGWRILLENERDHGWVFVMNQWDRGHPLQVDDFAKLLAQGGFTDPVLYRTDSRPERDRRKDDDFPQLEGMIQGLADRRVREELTRHNLEGRMQGLAQAVSSLVEKLGDDESLQRLGESWRRLWPETSAKLWRGLEWPVSELALRFVQREGDPLRRSLDLHKTARSDAATAQDQPISHLLWDEWTQLCFDDTLDRLILEADILNLPSNPLRDTLRPVRNQASRVVLDQAQTALRHALAYPGNAWQRLLLKLSGLLTVVVPLAATGWVSYEVVAHYYHSLQTETPFLGTDFAIHSGLVIAVAWLLPYLLYRKLRPSAEKAARRGLTNGLEAAFEQLSRHVTEQVSSFQHSGRSLRMEGLNIVEQARSRSLPAGVSYQSPFSRLLATAKT
jgi:energy-coupling factor transporter ATP-binding protein EcfA2